MPTWSDLFSEVGLSPGPHDSLRRKYLKKLADKTGRNVIAYYSGFLQKPTVPDSGINDTDKIGFMAAIQGLDREKGLDLILHTQGGETAATESIVDYLRSMFGTDIRAIVPQLAMSGGTMIACSCKSIVMGKQSSLGPIDPQFRGVPAHGIIEEFKQASEEIRSDPSKVPVWQPIIAKYMPTLIGECQKAIVWANEMVKNWLVNGMLQGEANPNSIADGIINELGDHAVTKSHARHLSASKCKEIKLKIEMMEDDQDLQDAILAVHYAFMLTFAQTPAVKIIENHDGKAFINATTGPNPPVS